MESILIIALIILGIMILKKVVKLTLKASFIIGCICIAIYLCSQYGLI